MPSSLQQSKRSSGSSRLVSGGADSSSGGDPERVFPHSTSLGPSLSLEVKFGAELLLFVCLGHKLGSVGLFTFTCFVMGSFLPCPAPAEKDDFVITDASQYHRYQVVLFFKLPGKR